jgi:hypothetical protein
MGKRAINAIGCLLVAAFLTVCTGVLAYGLVAAALASAVHASDCLPASSRANGTCPDPAPSVTTVAPPGYRPVPAGQPTNPP